MKIEIDKTLRIESLAGIWKEMLPRITEPSDTPVVFDLQGVEDFDSAGFQFILFLLKLTREHPGTYRFEGAGEGITRAFSESGFYYVNDKKELSHE